MPGLVLGLGGQVAVQPVGRTWIDFSHPWPLPTLGLLYLDGLSEGGTGFPNFLQRWAGHPQLHPRPRRPNRPAATAPLAPHSQRPPPRLGDPRPLVAPAEHRDQVDEARGDQLLGWALVPRVELCRVGIDAASVAKKAALGRG